MNDRELAQNNLEHDPFLQGFLARIPPRTAASFTNNQLAELKRVFQTRAQRPHYVDIRLSVPVLKKRFYLVFLLGKEKRRIKRVEAYVGKPANQTLVRLSAVVLIASSIFSAYMINQLWVSRHVNQTENQTPVRLLKSEN
ncbi:hypothetical protein ACQFX9_04300 [Aliinostoc sp. HNIBRCY26]|uniref:hypothetical protein n=1 Tax=Aliinostoc sp. HNIBRCY26 TaxID=3418997 RepID=UPI003D025C3F